MVQSFIHSFIFVELDTYHSKSLLTLIIVSVYHSKRDLAVSVPTHCKVATRGEIHSLISLYSHHVRLESNEEKYHHSHFTLQKRRRLPPASFLKTMFTKIKNDTKISEYFQAICSPYWDGASCFPPSLANTVVTIPCMATYFTKRFNTNCEFCS